MKGIRLYIQLICCSVAIFALTGCASTRLTSQSDPALAGKRYHKILVQFDLMNLELRRDAEMTFQTKLAQYQVECIAAHQLLFPGKYYSDSEVINIIDSNQIDAVLIVSLSDAGVSSTYIPPTYQTQTNAWINGNYLSGSSTTRTYGGYNINKPWASFSAKLIDVDAKNVVWIASAQTKGNGYAKAKTLLRSMANKTADRLVQEQRVSRSGKLKSNESSSNEPTAYRNQTRLPNLRRVVPSVNEYTDKQILTSYRKKYSYLKKKSDDELIKFIETKYSKAKKQNDPVEVRY